VVLDLGPFTPRTSARHVLPSLALLTPRPYSVRFEVSGRWAGAWSSWIGTVTLGDDVFAPIAAAAGALNADIDEVVAASPIDSVRLRVRVGGPGRDAIFDAPWLVSLSVWDGTLDAASATPERVRLVVPPRTQMTAPEPIRLRICSPASVAMTLAFFGREVATLALADEVLHAPTDRYGVWPAATKAGGAHGVPGYLLRFPSWDAAAWCLARGLPIVASVRFNTGELTGSPIAETTGHLIVITGLDGDDVFVNDPAAPSEHDVARCYRQDEMTRAWLDGSGVGYVFLRPP
jgi:hypothetical protein